MSAAPRSTAYSPVRPSRRDSSSVRFRRLAGFRPRGVTCRLRPAQAQTARRSAAPTTPPRLPRVAASGRRSTPRSPPPSAAVPRHQAPTLRPKLEKENAMKIKLDAAAVLAATCEPGKKRTDYWDLITTGFVLECRSNGGKTYCLRYFDAHGRQRQHRIGAATDLDFSSARKEARRLRSIVVLGGDPAAVRDEKRATISFFQLASQVLEHAKTFQKRPENTDSVLRVHLLPRWGRLRLDEIKTQDIAKWLGEKRASGLAPATCAKIRTVFNRCFVLALRWQTPGLTANPVQGISRPKFNNARERYLSPAEAQRLIRAAGRSVNVQLAPIVSLLLLSGLRKNELIRAQWSQVDIKNRQFFVPDSKTGKSRHVPLSQAAINVIEQLPKFDNCPWLITNPATLRPYKDIKRAWMTARDEAQLHGLRIHDLRHAAASLLIGAGVDLFLVGKVLGHADYKSTMRYSHISNENLVKAVESASASLNVDWSGSLSHGV